VSKADKSVHVKVPESFFVLFFFVRGVTEKSVKILTISYLLMDLIKGIKELLLGDRSNTEQVSWRVQFW
jgi:hypothetical protein